MADLPADPQMQQLLMAQQLRQPQQPEGAHAYPYDMDAHSVYTSPDQPLQHENFNFPGTEHATAFPAPDQSAHAEPQPQQPIELPQSNIENPYALRGGGHVGYETTSQRAMPQPTPAMAAMQQTPGMTVHGGFTPEAAMQPLPDQTVRPRSALGRTLHQMFKGGLLGWKDR